MNQSNKALREKLLGLRLHRINGTTWEKGVGFTVVLRDEEIKQILTLVTDHIKGNSLEAERVSYQPKDHNGIENWPIVNQPVLIIPQSILEEVSNGK